MSVAFTFRLPADTDCVGIVCPTALLVGNQLYGRSLALRQTLSLPCQVAAVGALSPDGQWGYLGERDGCSFYGYQKINTATNAAVETVFLPFAPSRMVALPDNQRLLVVAWDWIGVVDLR